MLITRVHDQNILMFYYLTYVTGHEKIGLICTQNSTTFLNFKLQ